MPNRCQMIMAVFLFTCCLMFVAHAQPQTDARREAESITKQTVEFGARGLIQIVDSDGSVEVEGWDKDEVELTVTKRTQKKYEPKDLAKALKGLEKVNVSMNLIDESTLLVVNTTFPSRTPTRLLRGKTNLQWFEPFHEPVDGGLTRSGRHRVTGLFLNP